MVESTAPLTRLTVDFALEPTGAATYVTSGYGNLCFNDGDAFSRAARWCEMPLHTFLYSALLDRLSEVQAAMEEERIGVS